MRVLDTDVLVDIVRGFPAALQWIAGQTPPPGVVGFAYMEVIDGCKSKQEVARVQSLMAPLPIFWPSDVGCGRALALLAGYRLSHNLGLLDALIAATALDQGRRSVRSMSSTSLPCRDWSRSSPMPADGNNVAALTALGGKRVLQWESWFGEYLSPMT